jgi:hypothetical protein
MKTVSWTLIAALFLSAAYLALPASHGPQMHMIDNPNCFPVGTEGVDGFAMCTGDVYRALKFERT